MAIHPNTHFTTTITVAIFLSIIMAMILISDRGLVSGQECQGDVQGLTSQCAMYVQRAGPPIDPSPACCSVVSRVDIPCVCNYITKDIERIIDMSKVAHVATVCGKPLAPGTKCGSFIAYDEVSESPIPSEESEAPSPGMQVSEAPGPGVGEAPLYSSEDETIWAKYYPWN